MRKTKELTITAENRDKGKKFVLTEMPADQGERWALRAILALSNTGAAIPNDIFSAIKEPDAGWAILAVVGVQAMGMLPADKAQPLFDELWPACVRYSHKPGQPLQEILPGAHSQIEEVSTRVTIYRELFELHTSFSLPAEPPTSGTQTPGEVVAGGNWISSMCRALSVLLWRAVSRP